MWRASIAAGARIAGWKARESRNRRISKEGVELDVIAGDIEGGMIEDVECIKVVSQREPLGHFEVLEDPEIETLLKWAAEYVAATTGVTVLERVADSAARITWRHTIGSRHVRRRNSKRCCVEHRLESVHAGGALKNRIAGSGSNSTDGNDWVSNKVLSVSPIDTGSAAAEINHAVRLAALEHCNPIYAPAIRDRLQPSTATGDYGKVVVITHREDMSAIKIGASIGRARIIVIID